MFACSKRRRPNVIIVVAFVWTCAFPSAGQAHLERDSRHNNLNDANNVYAGRYVTKSRYSRAWPQERVVPRFRRDFMYVASSDEAVLLDDSQLTHNTTQVIDDVKCFKECNNAWRLAFEKRFDMRVADFYDFPLHPKILDYANFVSYCELAEEQNRCFIERCNDPSAERIFSPSNFLCSFKRNQFMRTRPCFEETEPLTFLKCDQRCHKSAAALTRRVARAVNTSTVAPTTVTADAMLSTVTKATTSTSATNFTTTTTTPPTTTTTSTTTTSTVMLSSTKTTNISTTSGMPFLDNHDAINTLLKAHAVAADDASQQDRAEAGKVFIKSEMDSYERELDLLCTFQECYKQCHESILREICAPGLADNAVDLIASFVNWHATDVYDWHTVTQNAARLPQSCVRLASAAATAASSSTLAASDSATDITTAAFAL